MDYTLQELIDMGAWSMEGHVGRQMMQAIEDGVCILGDNDARDAYGNHIPAWWMVEPGTMGSPEYAAERGWDGDLEAYQARRPEMIAEWEQAHA